MNTLCLGGVFSVFFFFGEMLNLEILRHWSFYVCHKLILFVHALEKGFGFVSFFPLHLHSSMDIRILHDIGVDLDLWHDIIVEIIEHRTISNLSIGTSSANAHLLYLRLHGNHGHFWIQMHVLFFFRDWPTEKQRKSHGFSIIMCLLSYGDRSGISTRKLTMGPFFAFFC